MKVLVTANKVPFMPGGADYHIRGLVDALRSGKIAGAGLDVTDPEPLPQKHPLWGMENVIVTPHVASSGGNRGRRRD